MIDIWNLRSRSVPSMISSRGSLDRGTEISYTRLKSVLEVPTPGMKASSYFSLSRRNQIVKMEVTYFRDRKKQFSITFCAQVEVHAVFVEG